MGTRQKRNLAQRGMTLVELMVVVAIVGVLSTIAIVMITRGPGLSMVANGIANEVGEASRKAVAAGPVDPNIVAAEGFTARSRLFIGVDASNSLHYYSVEIRRENTGPVPSSSWEEVTRTYLPDDMIVAGTELDIARTEAGSANVTPLPTGGVSLECEVSGRCQSATIYLQTTDSTPEKQRVVVMALSAAPLVLANW